MVIAQIEYMGTVTRPFITILDRCRRRIGVEVRAGEFHRCVVSGLRMGWHKNAQLIVGWQAAALLAGRLSS